ncbi:AAA family ATPase [Roseomonas aeriglobus]|nr:AAA family ATPase [Roseomonas aeriglobus]
MYEEHYGLTGRPFQLTPDPRFWFDTATHKKAMAYLGYGLSQGEGFIVITGDIGAGKTTLVGHLTDTVDADRLNVIKIVSTQIVADDLLRTVCAGLGVDADGMTKAAMLASIERGLHAVARGGRRTLLIVDEAQALPVDSLEELRMLSNFQAGGHAMLQIFLLGQPEFRDKLAADGLEQLRQRVIAMHHLGPMEADELEAYLVHRLSICGWTGTPRFNTQALATIYAWSGGIPRRINNLVSRVLLYGAMEGVETFTAAHVHAVADDLAGDGMRGAAPVKSAPVADEATAAPVTEPDVADEPTPAPLPIQAEAPVVDTPRPIAVETPVEAPLDMPVETPAPVAADPEPIAMRPVEISTTPRLFDPVKLRGRRSILAPVDAAPEGPIEPAPHVEPDPVPEPEPVVAAAPPEPEPTVMEWPLRQPERQPDPEPTPVAAPAPVADLDLARRLAVIDKRMDEQDEAMRRILTLMVDWMETGRGDAGELRGKLG